MSSYKEDSSNVAAGISKASQIEAIIMPQSVDGNACGQITYYHN